MAGDYYQTCAYPKPAAIKEMHRLCIKSLLAIGITDENEIFKAVDDMWNEAYPGRR